MQWRSPQRSGMTWDDEEQKKMIWWLVIAE
jgi:hypothetical protein